MRPTLEYLRDKFKYYNHLCFNDEIPEVPIYLVKMKGFLGRTRCLNIQSEIQKHIEIDINIRFDLPEEEYISTLVHEMIHTYIIFYDLKDDGAHGSIFHSLMNRISSNFGINIRITYNPSVEERPSGVPRWRYICVICNSENECGILVVARNKVFNYWDCLDHATNIKYVEWYLSCDPYFDSFPTAVSSLRVCAIDKVVLYSHLLNAEKLIREGNTIHLEQ